MKKLEPVHFGHLPVWIEGNVYLNGAEACKNEVNGLVISDKEAKVDLVEKEGSYYLDTNVYDLVGEFKDRMIHSDILGKAFEPEQRFENPDGTAIQFDKDYFGGHRGMDVIPGPFAQAEDAKKVLF